MKVYLVGGAVRDQLLGLPVDERDWVVVGAKPEQLLQQGYKQVGRDFPVFLHPNTKEEYALARMERKSGTGYYGFECDFSQKVSLEEDLARRDLTINAMALDQEGQLIDPYGGEEDLKNKILRHVSPAFIEDPVRVLRVARFAARFHYLGFTLANETRSLMYSMVKRGELAHLVPERIWQEWQSSLVERNPEQFIASLRACDALKVILPEISLLFGVPNSPKYHLEIDSGVHSLLVLQAAVALSPDPVIRFAALVHDLGKALTPIQEWPKHLAHEERGVGVIEALCHRLKIPNSYRQLAIRVAGFHLSIHRLSELSAGAIVSLLEQIDAFRRPQLFDQVLIVCEADLQGCGRTVNTQHRQLWSTILSECLKIKAKTINEAAYKGKEIKEKIHQLRVACVDELLTIWKLNEK